ncbi:MAG: NUDIX domain-containing protein [Candidatus Aquicultorales bacterium]
MQRKTFALSVKAVVLDAEGRILVLKRSSSSKANAGKWEFPGGKVEREGLEEALFREVREETGLAIELTSVAGHGQSESPANKIAYLFVEARAVGGAVRLSGEHDEYRWVSRTELRGLDICRQFKRFVEEYSKA